MQLRWQEEVIRTGQLKTKWGLIFYYPGYKENTYEKKGRKFFKDFPKVCNYTVQNIATAEINPIGARCVWQYFKQEKLRSRLVNTVHDSTVGEIHPNEKMVVDKIFTQAYTRDVDSILKKLYGLEFKLPMTIESDFHLHWTKD